MMLSSTVSMSVGCYLQLSSRGSEMGSFGVIWVVKREESSSDAGRNTGGTLGYATHQMAIAMPARRIATVKVSRFIARAFAIL